MGLLDDAIREHLELKRQRGADPSEVAREQREALDAPVQGAPAEDMAPAAGDTASAAPLVDPPAATASPVAAIAADTPADAAPPALPDVPADVPGAGETAELDMSSVLGEDLDGAAEPAAAPDTSSSQEDSLEWEMPGEAAAAGETEESAEDVLEETPEFLRDTPEQERLWFEQRPPRDFDFDK